MRRYEYRRHSSLLAPILLLGFAATPSSAMLQPATRIAETRNLLVLRQSQQRSLPHTFLVRTDRSGITSSAESGLQNSNSEIARVSLSGAFFAGDPPLEKQSKAQPKINNAKLGINSSSEIVSENDVLQVATSLASQSRANADLLQTLELKDEALFQAQTAVSSLEGALESAVSNLESMQQQLQLKVSRLEKELYFAREELGDARVKLSQTLSDLDSTNAKLEQSLSERNVIKRELSQTQDALRKAEARLDKFKVSSPSAIEGNRSNLPSKKSESIAWQLWPSISKGAIPLLNDWVIIKGNPEGELQISGRVTNHPEIPDGDSIVTSPIADATMAVERKIVVTSSGSRYRLGSPLGVPTADSQITSINKGRKPKLNYITNELRTKECSSVNPDLTGETLGNGRYLLAGAAVPSVNGRSFIQTVYRAASNGKPAGEALVAKVSPNTNAMKREFANYQKVSGGLKRGNFIRRFEFLPVAGSEMPDKSVLIMQRGIADVKAYMPTVGGRLEGDLLVDCALTALKCVESLHAAKLVWNDLKTENFVVVENETNGDVCFKGIDLESCMPVKSNPVDYTPEACPPEFAESFLRGQAGDFLLEYSYDVWSFGMFLYEISTGRGFFDGMAAQQITKALPNFQPQVDNVPDRQLADLILQCLSRNPKDRPSFVRIARHPYLADALSSKSPFNFLFK